MVKLILSYFIGTFLRISKHFTLVISICICTSSCDYDNNFQKKYDGVIGNNIKTTFDLEVSKDEVTGFYYYNKYGEVIQIQGARIGNSLRFDGIFEGEIIDKFKGDIGDNGVIFGTRTNEKGTDQMTLNLKPVIIKPEKGFNWSNLIWFLVVGLFFISVLLISKKFLKKGEKPIPLNNKERPWEQKNIPTKNKIEPSERQEKPTNVFDPNSTKKGRNFEAYVEHYLFPIDRYEKLHETPKVENSIDLKDKLLMDPDFKFRDRENGKEFWVECKYRNGILDDNKKIKWSNPKQRLRYMSKEAKGEPVLIVLGCYGKSYKPHKIYLIPLKKIEFDSFYRSFLKEFEFYTNKPVFSEKLWEILYD